MPLPEKANEIAKRIDKLDQLNEVALGEEAVIGVEHEEEIEKQARKLDGKLDATSKAALDKNLDEQQKAFDELTDATDKNLNQFVA